jgi:hypothetical protein
MVNLKSFPLWKSSSGILTRNYLWGWAAKWDSQSRMTPCPVKLARGKLPCGKWLTMLEAGE